MRISLSHRQALVVGAFFGLAILGIVLTVTWTVAAGIVVALLLQVLLLAGLVVVAKQVSAGKRSIRQDLSNAMSGELSRLRAAVNEVNAVSPIRQALEVVGRDRIDSAERFSKIAKVNQALIRDMEHMRIELTSLAQDTKRGFHQVTTDAWSMHNLVRLVEHPGPFPAPGGWAVTPDTLVELVTRVQSDPRDLLVVECGSGTSTVWIAHCHLAKAGHGRVVSLEHDPEYAAATRMHLHRLGLDDWAEVRDAPLTDVEIAGGTTQWYDPRALADLTEIDLLLVDGPPWRTSDDARYPALTMFAQRLATDATVVLDDVKRDPESRIAERWTGEEHDGITVVPEYRTDRAQFFRVVRATTRSVGAVMGPANGSATLGSDSRRDPAGG